MPMAKQQETQKTFWQQWGMKLVIALAVIGLGYLIQRSIIVIPDYEKHKSVDDTLPLTGFGVMKMERRWW